MSKNNIVNAIVFWFVILCSGLGISCNGVPDVNDIESDNDNSKIVNEKSDNNDGNTNASENKRQTYKLFSDEFFADMYKIHRKVESYIGIRKQLKQEVNDTVGFGNQYVYQDGNKKPYKLSKAPTKLLDRIEKAEREYDKDWFFEHQTKPHIENDFSRLETYYKNIKVKDKEKLPDLKDWDMNKLQALLEKMYQLPAWVTDHVLPMLVELEIQLKKVNEGLANGTITKENAEKQKEEIEQNMADAFSYYQGGDGVYDGSYARGYILGLYYIGKIDIDKINEFRDDGIYVLNKEKTATSLPDSYIKQIKQKKLIKKDDVMVPDTDENGNQKYDKKHNKLYKKVDRVEVIVEYNIDKDSIEKNIDKIRGKKTQDKMLTPEAEKNIEALMKSAKDNFDNKKYDKSIDEYTKIIELDKTNADAHVGLVKSYAQLLNQEKNIDKAIENYEKSCQKIRNLYANNIDNLDETKLGKFYYWVGKIREALADKYKEKKRYDDASKQYESAWRNFASAHDFGTDSKESLMRVYDSIKSVKEGKNNPKEKLKAQEKGKNNSKEKSEKPKTEKYQTDIEKYKKRIEKDKTNYNAYSELAYAYWKSGNFEEGSKYLSEVYKKNKNFLNDKKLSGFYFNVGSLREEWADKYLEQGKYKEAEEQYNKSLNNFKAADSKSKNKIKEVEEKIKKVKALRKKNVFNEAVKNIKNLYSIKINNKTYNLEYDSNANIAKVINIDSNEVIGTLNYNPEELYEMYVVNEDDEMPEKVKKISYLKVKNNYSNQTYVIDADLHKIIGKIKYGSNTDVAQVINIDTNEIVGILKHSPKELGEIFNNNKERA